MSNELLDVVADLPAGPEKTVQHKIYARFWTAASGDK
jgi:hypothetical protein